MSETLWTTDTITDTPPAPAPVSARQPTTPTTSRDALYERMKEKIATNPALDRALVSFQGNKQLPFSSWFKYREGFSEALVRYLLQTLRPEPGILLDPFAGAGSALFAASALGWKASGIELLPVGIHACQARLLASSVAVEAFQAAATAALQINFAACYDARYAFQHIAITRGAFPPPAEEELAGYLAWCHTSIEDANVRALMLYAAFCILEEISYTRKDGQYLRWDARAGRSWGKKPFNKGPILSFREALQGKLQQMAGDLGTRPVQQTLFGENLPPQAMGEHPEMRQGSSLELLPTMEANSIDCILTSPPYANRYDYTRTYALELAFLGYTDEQVKQLRQAMLSCTVENKDKRAFLQRYYQQIERQQAFQHIDTVFQQQAALHEALTILEQYRREGKLNNDNIARLVHNYFYEMCFVIYEMARLLKPGGIIAMVNDNVRYAGEEIPVDLILSDMAESFGLTTRHIWTLERGKGNSSQQMGEHGRSELRKCIYVWEKAASTTLKWKLLAMSSMGAV